MAQDQQHQKIIFKLSELEHAYGPKVHLLSSPLMLSFLAKLGSPQTHQPLVNELVSFLYQSLFDQAVNFLFPKKLEKIETRMKGSHPEAVYEGEVINPEVRCVTVNLARAGIFPSHICYQKLNYLMNPQMVRQDHFYLSRKCNEAGQVVGVNVAGSKIGGPVDESIIMIPDPMGATGSTIREVYDHYKMRVGGRPLLMMALHLIITPEYLKNITNNCPDLHIFALRLDRGLSPYDILKLTPGVQWDLERGLNDHHYIVPGAGGLGEIMNNSFC